jgi:hypothetical protein
MNLFSLIRNSSFIKNEGSKNLKDALHVGLLGKKTKITAAPGHTMNIKVLVNGKDNHWQGRTARKRYP